MENRISDSLIQALDASIYSEMYEYINKSKECNQGDTTHEEIIQDT